MDRKDVAAALDEIAAYLELRGDDAFRVRAYRTAARAIAHFNGDLRTALREGTLGELRGVGPTTQEVIADLLDTGRSATLASLRDSIPPGLVAMLEVPGLGVAKVRQIHAALRVDSVDELEAAARDGRLARVPRFGPRTAERVLRGIQYRRQIAEVRLLHHARQDAAELTRILEAVEGITRVAVAGSLRRGSELIRDLDFVVELRGDPAALVERLGRLASVRESVHEQAVTLRFTSGAAVDVYWALPERFGFQLLTVTGNAGHLRALKARAEALGVTWSDEGLIQGGRLLPCPEEHDVYRVLALPFVPPELREGDIEIELAAADALPHLVDTADLRGFLHCHSNYSDGVSTIAQWAEACRAAGYTYLGITDHSQAALEAGGLGADDVPRQHAEIDAVNASLQGFRVLKGVEADILPDGTLDYSADLRARFDFVIASVHTQLGMSERDMTERILRAMDDRSMVILGHPTGRLLRSRNSYPVDLDAVFDKAARTGIAIEINADPQRLDLDWRSVRRAAAKGVTISIGADAHGITGMDNVGLGVTVARKGGLTAAQVLNTRSLAHFEAFAARRRR